MSKWFFGPLLSNGRQRVGAFLKKDVEKKRLNIRIQWNAGTACVSECVLKTLACRGLRVGPSKLQSPEPKKFEKNKFVFNSRTLKNGHREHTKGVMQPYAS